MQKEYQESFGCEASLEEVADILGISVDHVKDAIKSRQAKYTTSIDSPIDDEDRGRTLGETIKDDRSTSLDEVLDNQKIKEAILNSLSSLTKREELVLRLRFGIEDVSEDDQYVYEIEEK